MSKTLERCNQCGQEPHRGSVMFMGYHIECMKCSICIPFPPAKTIDEAEAEWNAAQRDERKSKGVE